MGSSDVPEPPLPLPAAAVDADVLLALIGRGSGVVAVAEVVLDDELADELVEDEAASTTVKLKLPLTGCPSALVTL